MKQCILISLLLFVTQAHSSFESQLQAAEQVLYNQGSFPKPDAIITVTQPDEFRLPTDNDFKYIRLHTPHIADSDLCEKWPKEQQYGVTLGNHPNFPHVVIATIVTRTTHALTPSESQLLHYAIMQKLQESALKQQQQKTNARNVQLLETKLALITDKANLQRQLEETRANLAEQIKAASAQQKRRRAPHFDPQQE